MQTVYHGVGVGVGGDRIHVHADIYHDWLEPIDATSTEPSVPTTELS